jgi:hypothetical protein
MGIVGAVVAQSTLLQRYGYESSASRIKAVRYAPAYHREVHAQWHCQGVQPQDRFEYGRQSAAGRIRQAMHTIPRAAAG